MAGPWEKYQTPAAATAPSEAGPWQKYAGKKPYSPSGIGGVEMPLLDRFNTFVNSAVDQIPIVGPALSDFGAGVDAAFASVVEGKPVTKEERLSINKSQEEQYPIENVAGRVTGVVAPFIAAGYVPAAAKLLGMSGSMTSQVMLGAASGGAISGADTLARGGSLQEAGQNAVLGVGLGAAAPFVTRGVQAGWNALKGNPVVASPYRKVADALIRDGLTAQQADDVLRSLGPNAVLGDVGENLQGQVQALATMPGQAKSVIADALRPRAEGRNARIIMDVDNVLGPSPVPSQVRTGNQANMETLRPRYAELFRTNARAVDTTPIANELDSMIVNLRGESQQAARQVRRMLDIEGAPGNLDPYPGTLFEVRQAIDGMMETEANTKVISTLTGLRRQVDDMLAEAVPGIKDLDAQYAELARQNEALDEGGMLLSGGKEARRPSELVEQLIRDSAPPAGMGPSGVPFRLSQGARAEIDRIIGTTANDLVALKRAIGGQGDWNRAKLASLFGDDRANALIEVLERESKLQATENLAFGNSKTAATQAAQKEFSPEVGSLPPNMTWEGLVASLLTKGAASGLGAAKTATNPEVARILMTQGRLPQQLYSAVERAMLSRKPGLLAPASTSLVGTGALERRKPLEITVRGGAN